MLGAVVSGGLVRRLTGQVQPLPDDTVGTWRGAGDPGAAMCILVVGGRHIAHCTAWNAEARMVEIDLAIPRAGHSPTIALCDDEVVTRRLYLGEALEVYPDGTGAPAVPKPPNHWRYWTDNGWVNDKSEPIGGPVPTIIPALAVGEALEPGQRALVRNGRVYRAVGR